MTPSTEILNWLIIGFEQSTGSLTENFYYDKRESEFFSIMVNDYFMLDEEMNIASNVTTNYSKNQENSLIDRIKRIENKDSNIISIPRVTLNERKNLMQQFVDKLSDSKLIDMLNQQIENQDFRAEFDFYFGNEADELTKQKWEEEKNNFLYQQVETFLNLNNINVDKSTLWIVDSEGSISFDLTDDKENKTITITNEHKIEKQWWKFW
jgi:hypothetical protein